MGFLVVEAFAKRCRLRFSPWERRARVGTAVAEGVPVAVAEPLTYMNRSGNAVRLLLARWNLTQKALLVVHDDLDLPEGEIRIRRKGRSGGHNGVQSIIDALGTEQFLRVKVGIGRPPAGEDPVAFVLDGYTEREFARALEIAERAAEAVAWVAQGKIEEGMRRFH